MLLVSPPSPRRSPPSPRKSKCIFPKCNHPKCILAKFTRLVCLLSSVSLPTQAITSFHTEEKWNFPLTELWLWLVSHCNDVMMSVPLAATCVQFYSFKKQPHALRNPQYTSNFLAHFHFLLPWTTSPWIIAHLNSTNPMFSYAPLFSSNHPPTSQHTLLLAFGFEYGYGAVYD